MVESVNDSGLKLINYNDHINILNSSNEYGAKIRKSEKITSHRQVLDENYKVKMIW